MDAGVLGDIVSWQERETQAMGQPPAGGHWTDIACRVSAWVLRHPGWVIDPSPPRVLDPDGTRQAAGPDLGTLLDRLERADLQTESEQGQLALLRAKFGGQWSVTVCDGEWEARPRGILREDEAVTAPEAWLLAYRLGRRADLARSL